MRETKKIEKQLFKDEPIFLKEVEKNKGQKEIKKWKWTMNEYKNPDEVEVEMEKAKKNKAMAMKAVPSRSPNTEL